MPTAIHRRVAALQAGLDPTYVARLTSGWLVLGDPQVIPGYCLLLPDPVVPDLNALASPLRCHRFPFGADGDPGLPEADGDAGHQGQRDGEGGAIDQFISS